MLNTARDRIGAATGAAFVILIFAGNTLASAGSSQETHPSGQQVLKDIAHQTSSGSVTLGIVMEVLGFLAFMPFLGYLAVTLRRRAGGAEVLGATAVAAGIVMLAVKLGSAAPSGALQLDYKHLSPELAQTLNDINSMAFVISWLPFTVFVLAGAAALWQARLVGRPTAMLGLFFGFAGIPLAILGFLDPVSANPVAFLLGMLWLLVVSVQLAVKPGGTNDGGPTPSEALGLRLPVEA